MRIDGDMKVTMKKFLGSLALVVVASLLFGVAADPTKPVPWSRTASAADPTKPVPWNHGVAPDADKVAADPTKPVPWKIAESDDPTKPVPWKNG